MTMGYTVLVSITYFVGPIRFAPFGILMVKKLIIVHVLLTITYIIYLGFPHMYRRLNMYL